MRLDLRRTNSAVKKRLEIAYNTFEPTFVAHSNVNNTNYDYELGGIYRTYGGR
jgi:hypothetical protein